MPLLLDRDTWSGGKVWSERVRWPVTWHSSTVSIDMQVGWSHYADVRTVSILPNADRGAKYCDQRVCMFVCLSRKTTRPHFTKFSVHFICGRGLVVLWRQCDTLCISGFEDDVTHINNAANRQIKDGMYVSSSSSGSGCGTGGKVCRLWRTASCCWRRELSM